MIRRRCGWPVAMIAGSGLASLVAVALMGPADAARGQDPATIAGDEPSAVAGSEGCPPASGDETTTSTAGAAGTDPACTDVTPTEEEPPAPDPVDEGGTGDDGDPGTGDDGDPGTGDDDGGPGDGNQGSGGDRDRSDKSGGTGGGGTGGVEAPRSGNRQSTVSGGDRDRAKRGSDSGGGGAEAGAGIAVNSVISVPTPFGTQSVAGGAFAIPSFLLPIYRECGKEYRIPWAVLAAINQVETGFGTNLKVSSAGAVGWMQFLPSSWSAYGVDANDDGRRDPYEPKDAICAAARYLRAAGAEDDLRSAIYAYNHAQWYVDLVISLARRYELAYVLEPLPRAARLDPDFARRLTRVARRDGVDWALLLAVLRARGETGRAPVDEMELSALSERIAEAGRGVPEGRLGQLADAISEKPRSALRIAALVHYNHAVGLRGLVRGLRAVEGDLQTRVLASKRLSIYPGGREDVAAERIDVRVLVLLLYLAERYDGVGVTSLISGHGYFARPGVPSAHVYGQAVDIAELDGIPVLGNQEPGGVIEQALMDILLLPGELQPTQVISLFDFGGPSFAAADHHDHIHVGY